MFLKQERLKWMILKEKNSLVLSEVKISIFYENILRNVQHINFAYFSGGGRPPPPLADAAAKNASLFYVLP